jgi:hypothetical protein
VWVKGETFHSTDDLISMLVARFPHAWGSSDKYPKGLTPQRFGRMLVKNYGVYSDRTADKVRGYSARSFDVACRSVRVPPIEPAKPVETAQPALIPHQQDGDGHEPLPRRDGCVCISQPKPCFHCRQFASKQEKQA